MSDNMTTWADAHPELLGIFGHPFSPEGQEHRKKSFIPWPAEVYATNLTTSQPTVVLAATGELIVHGYDGWVLNSTDGGRKWQNLGCAPLICEAPPGFKLMATSIDGCGITEKGTILVQSAVQYNSSGRFVDLDKPSHHSDIYVFRSTDHGKTWDKPIKLNAGPIENSAGGVRTRFFRLPNGIIALCIGTFRQSKSGDPLPASENYMQAFIWSSSDDGKTWQRGAKTICLHGDEPDLLVLSSGRILAAIRYQRLKLPSDPPELASPNTMRNDSPPYAKSKEVGTTVARNTAIIYSDDKGETWSTPRLVTGLDEQTGCLVQLSDGTVILVFGHKTDGTGQRFMLSYDQGETWSRHVYFLSTEGLYASSVLLDDGTIVTVTHRIVNKIAKLYSLRWRPPSREQVAKGGFWTPRIAEPLGIRRSASDDQNQ